MAISAASGRICPSEDSVKKLKEVASSGSLLNHLVKKEADRAALLNERFSLAFSTDSAVFVRLEYVRRRPGYWESSTSIKR